MFGVLKSVMGLDVGKRGSGRRYLFSLASELERVSENQCANHSRVVETAFRLRNLLRGKLVKLSRAEKARILKTMNKVKVRALVGGTPDCYRTFMSLDSIASDMYNFL